MVGPYQCRNTFRKARPYHHMVAWKSAFLKTLNELHALTGWKLRKPTPLHSAVYTDIGIYAVRLAPYHSHIFGTQPKMSHPCEIPIKFMCKRFRPPKPPSDAFSKIS